MTVPRFYPEEGDLLQRAASLRDAYNAARPFPHAVIDGLFPEVVLDAILDEFPQPGQCDWFRFDNPREQKLGTRATEGLGAATRDFLCRLNEPGFVKFVESVTGIGALVPDPAYHGGGLHQIEPGGFLKIHADFNWHRQLQLYRRVNLIVYLNRSWEPRYGGHLQLWNRDMSACEATVSPVFNRTVIFTTTDSSFHGHPDPLNCPAGRTRKSLALYYYAKEPPPSATVDAHCTIFRQRPGEAFGSG